jgi:hypothetical protein
VRRSFAAVISILILLFTTALSGETAPSADMLLQRGKDNFRSGHYQEAVTDLQAASAAFLTPEQKQAYIASGHLASLPKFEESLVYLALAQSHLGNDGEARTAVTRLLNAERIEPVYAGLKLDPDAGEFEKIVVALMPAVPLPPNAQLAAGGATTPTQSASVATTNSVPPPPPATPAPVEQTAMSTPAPAATPAPIFTPTGATTEPTLTASHAPEPAAEPVQTASVPPPPPPAVDAPAPVPAPTEAAVVQTADQSSKLAVQPTLAAERVAMLKAIDEQVAKQVAEKVAAARADIERDAQQKIAAEREASQRAAESQIAEGRQAAEKAAQERVAQERDAARKEADQKIAQERAAAEKAADQRIAEERAAMEKASAAKIAQEREAAQRAADEKIAAERAAAEREAAAKLAEAEAQARRGLLASLRQADSAAANGQVADASRIYAQLASTPGVSREAVAAAAAGLYRTGDFASAVKAFQRLGTFARGEEDLRYYNAVALFETGHYDQAKKELACALPFIQVNEDVARYRVKIEQMAAQQAMR